MDYNSLLQKAYKEVTPMKESERFEIKKVTGHHEGTKTVITNFTQVASCIRREPTHLMKALSKELASQSELSGERLILSRKLASKVINEKIEKYVKQYVLCRNCKKPDTTILREKNRSLLHCLACGSKYPIADL